MINAFIKRVKNRLIREIFYFYHKTLSLFRECIFKDVVILSSSVGPFFYNWGDDVTIKLINNINPALKVNQYNYTWNIFKKNDYLCIGSIIHRMTTPRSIIWGAGSANSDTPLTHKPYLVLAVRGPLTRSYLLDNGVECPEVYGDPALLFPLYYQPSVKKKYKLGVIPHFFDKKNEKLLTVAKDESINIIDVQNVTNYTDFIDEINSCEYICSSSLHGLIIADAYNIPNLWINFPERTDEHFKFMDYFLSIHRSPYKPYIVKSDSFKEEILSFIKKEWRAPNIDLEPLKSVCPFTHF